MSMLLHLLLWRFPFHSNKTLPGLPCLPYDFEANQLWFEAGAIQHRLGKNLILDDMVELLDFPGEHPGLDHLLFESVISFWLKSLRVGISAAFP